MKKRLLCLLLLLPVLLISTFAWTGGVEPRTGKDKISKKFEKTVDKRVGDCYNTTEQ